MAEQIITKTCRVCKKTKTITQFFKHSVSKDGHQSQCKFCSYEYKKRYRQTEKGKNNRRKETQRYNQTAKGKAVHKRAISKYKNRHPERMKARKEVEKAIRTGQLSQIDLLQCSCGKPAKHYHHNKGYEQEHWLTVVPFCNKCHTQIKKSS